MSKTKKAPEAEPESGIKAVDNTDVKPAERKKPKTESYELVEGLKQVNYK